MAQPKAWQDVAPRLIDVAMGRARRRPGHPQRPLGQRPFGRDHRRHAISPSSPAASPTVGPDAGHAIGPGTQVIDADGRYPGAWAVRRAHARRERHADGHRVRPRRDPARHDLDVHRSARDRQRARPRGRPADARRGGGAADQRVRADAELRAERARPGERRRAHRRRRTSREAMRWPQHHRARRDDELSRRRRQRRPDAGRDRRDAGRRQDRRRALCLARSGPALPRLCRRRAGRRPRGHARGGRHRPRAPGHAGDAAAGLGLVRRRARRSRR